MAVALQRRESSGPAEARTGSAEEYETESGKGVGDQGDTEGDVELSQCWMGEKILQRMVFMGGAVEIGSGEASRGVDQRSFGRDPELLSMPNQQCCCGGFEFQDRVSETESMRVQER